MARKGWIYTEDGRTIEKGSPEHEEYVGSKSTIAFIPDDADFVSPIDQKVYSGRAGMREHNRRHNVVSNRDLAGLPYKPSVQEYKPDRAAIRESVINAARKHGVL